MRKQTAKLVPIVKVTWHYANKLSPSFSVCYIRMYENYHADLRHIIATKVNHMLQGNIVYPKNALPTHQLSSTIVKTEVINHKKSHAYYFNLL